MLRQTSGVCCIHVLGVHLTFGGSTYTPGGSGQSGTKDEKNVNGSVWRMVINDHFNESVLMHMTYTPIKVVIEYIYPSSLFY